MSRFSFYRQSLTVTDICVLLAASKCCYVYCPIATDECKRKCLTDDKETCYDRLYAYFEKGEEEK